MLHAEEQKNDDLVTFNFDLRNTHPLTPSLLHVSALQ